MHQNKLFKYFPWKLGYGYAEIVENKHRNSVPIAWVRCSCGHFPPGLSPVRGPVNPHVLCTTRSLVTRRCKNMILSVVGREQGAPVEEPQEEDKISATPNQIAYREQYRPGQVFSVNSQELLDLQPERKAPAAPGAQPQQLYASEPRAELKQNLQYYILEPQLSRQIALQPSHALIARPSSTSDGGEASVGAALSVSDASSPNYEHELLALLGRSAKQDEPKQIYAPAPQSAAQSTAPQYIQINRYITKPSKKQTKQRSKVHNPSPQLPAAPEQYLIETTNIQQQPQQTIQAQQHQRLQQIQYQFKQQHQIEQQQQQQQLQQQQHQLQQQQHQLQQQQSQLQQQHQLQLQQYQKPVQTIRPMQALRYVSLPQAFYESSEPQGLKVVPAPKLQRPQVAYRFVQQLPQPDQASSKQFRVLQQPQIRQEQQRVSASNVDRPVAYLKRYQGLDKMRAVKIIEQPAPENFAPQSPQSIEEQYYVRPIYRQEQRARYEATHSPSVAMESSRVAESMKPPVSTIYVSKDHAPKKLLRPAPVRIELKPEHIVKLEPETPLENVRVEQPERNLEEERSHLPPPKNNKAYTQEEFAALIAAGYSVTPIPVGSLDDPAIQAQSRSAVEMAEQLQHRSLYSRKHQYVPFRSDEAP
ncbi:hypothetical protein EVAR_18227_1 [Eumeta japonica]|uniref:Uncharacterized protein n=1 Tax=Eumeta variegata TaxID=151549 RepID=A0A4C1UKB0_EUMVA|nr:hypothetical protein EVAR_18227_1 [Eumeta japonica]